MIKSKPKLLVSEQGNHWRTPQYVFDKLHKLRLLTPEYSDPFPWMHDLNLWDAMDGGKGWGDNNYINPPYNDSKQKEEIVKLTLKMHNQGANCTMCMPFDFDTIYHKKILAPRLEKLQFGVDWFFWSGRIKFIGYKSSSKQFFNLPEDEKPEGWENETVTFKGKELKKYVNGCGLGGSVIYSFLHKKPKLKKGDRVRITAKHFISNEGIYEIEGFGENGAIYLFGFKDELYFFENELELVTD